MAWVLGLIGAIIGLAIADENWLLGLASGFFIAFAIGARLRLQARVEALERELAVIRHASQNAAASAQPAPATDAAPAATEAAADGVDEAAWTPPAPVAAATGPAASAVPPPLPSGSVYAASPAAPSATASPPAAEAADTPPPPSPSRPSFEPAPQEPGGIERLLGTIRDWFTQGNVPVKVGVLVFFFGIAAALRYAAANGYLVVPIEVRMASIAAVGLLGMGIGWRQRALRPVFGLSLQGGGLGVLLMTVFASFRLYGLLPPTLAFALVVVLVAGSAVLAVAQDAPALAALGFLGGYLAPVLISTGSHDHIALFSYYALLNAAVFAVSWKRSWRVLNLIGFFFTFGVGTAWGVRFYRPELFASVEPFLILFFAFYVVIGLLYVLRQTTHRRPWVDGTLVFGTPLLALPLQAGLLKDDRMALAGSALAVAVLYLGLVRWLRRRGGEPLLSQACAVLALAFATLAVPLAFSAGTTASVWALEGAGAAWLGIRQNRSFPWLAGLGLQLLAAAAYLVGFSDRPALDPATELLVLNPSALGGILVAVGGFALSFVHDRWRPIRFLPALLFAWATGWLLFAWISQHDLAAREAIGAWRFSILWFAATIALAALVEQVLAWPRMRRLVAVSAWIVLPMMLFFPHRFGGPLAPSNLGVWLAYFGALAWALWRGRAQASRALASSHLLGLWTLVLAACIQAGRVADHDWGLGGGWEAAAAIAPLLLATVVLQRAPRLLAWPRADRFGGYRLGWFVPAAVLLCVFLLFGLTAEGVARPLRFVPLLNPLELALLAAALVLYALCEGRAADARRLWPLAGFALLTSATLRGVHHLHGESWSPAIFDSAMSQMALTVVWSLLGVAAWIGGSRGGSRRTWIAGAALMGVVLLKLIAVDRHYMGDVPGIASFVVVGLLMMGVGYIAPAPPKAQGAADPAPATREDAP